jgi:flagellar biosynthesis protein FliR
VLWNSYDLLANFFTGLSIICFCVLGLLVLLIPDINDKIIGVISSAIIGLLACGCIFKIIAMKVENENI